MREPGSDLVRGYYRRAYSGELRIALNVGEVLGVFDGARRVARLGAAIVAPVRSRILAEAWKLVERYHIYGADALQASTAKHLGAGLFLTADEGLNDVAAMENLKSIHLG